MSLATLILIVLAMWILRLYLEIRSLRNQLLEQSQELRQLKGRQEIQWEYLTAIVAHKKAS